MTPLERLLAEELPTGTFGGPRPEPDPTEPDPHAAQHLAELADAIRPQPRPRRHLRAVPGAA